MIKIITAYDHNMLDLHRLRLPKLQQYCAQHKYALEIFEIPQNFEREPSWYKISLLISELKKINNYEYIVWIDTDTIIYNKNLKIESIINSEKLLFISKDYNNINCGIFIIKKNLMMLDFLENIWNTTKKKFPQHNWWEQDAFIQLIEQNFIGINNYIKYVSPQILNCYEGFENNDTLFMHFAGGSRESKLSKMEKYVMSFLDKISIDENHIEMIYSLIICDKPSSVLEIGIGSGKTTSKIIEAFEYNNIIANIDCVDNFFDWGGQIPEHIKQIKNINLIISDEKGFIENCTKRYDFIISDADHEHTHLWVEKTIGLLNPGGLLIYHDITNKSYPNLYSVLNFVQTNKYSFMLFNKNSKTTERCDRGLLVIRK